MAEINVAQAIGKLMKAHGASHVFTFTGAPQDPLIHAQNHEGIKVVLGRSERSALAMGDAFARLTGKPTFGIVQYGPGATYLPASIIDAHWANSPLIAISGTTTTATRHRLEYQELDQAPMFPPMTRWAGDLPDPSRIADVLRTAVRAAVSGRPGPTYLGIPADWFARPTGLDEAAFYADPNCLTVPASRSAPAPGEVERAVEALSSARRPVIFAGGGVLLSGGWAELTALAEATGIPVVTTMPGKGAITDTHPLAVGTAGRYSRRVANETLAACDFCLAVGTRLGSMETDVFKFPKPSTRIVHIDADPMILGRTYVEEISIVADAKVALSMLLDAVVAGELPDAATRWADWRGKVQANVVAWREQLAQMAGRGVTDGRISPYSVLAALNDYIGGDDVVVADTGYMAVWAATLLDQKEAGRNTLRAAGSLGWAFPAAFGAKLAVGAGRRVFGLTGDGGIGYHLADLESALRLGTPVIQMVMNNSALAFEYHVQKHVHGEICPALTDFVDIDYAAVARAFGCHGERVTDADELIPALRRAEESGRPAVLDLVVSREPIPPVTRYEAVVQREV